MPKVSVIVPVYGVEKYIERCARSLFEQTLDDIEFIFVDDCTKDNSIAFLERVIEDYPNRKSQITILHHDVNKGLPQARKTGILASKGEYIACCDSDDWVDKDIYYKMYESAEMGTADVVISDYKETDGIMAKLFTCFGGYSANGYLDLLMNGQMTWALWNKMWKRTLFDNPITWPTGNMGEDMCLCMQLFFYAKQINYVGDSFYNYYVNVKSIARSHSEKKDINNYIQLKENVSIVKSFYKDKQISSDIQKGLYFLSFWPYKMLAHVEQLEYKNIYKNGIRRYALAIITNNLIPSRERLKALAMWLGIYPWISHKK